MDASISHTLLYALVLLIALVLDLGIGDPPTRFHPVGWLGRGIALLWRRRPRGGKLKLFLWGALIVVFGLLATMALPWPLQRFLLTTDGPARVAAILAAAIVLKASFSLRGLIKAAGRVGAALNARDVETARGLTARHLVSRPLEDADETAIVSAAIESLSENFTDSVASPMLWFAFGGLPAAWGYRFVNTADAMLGYRDGDREWGGKLAARFDDVLNWIPARLSAWVLVAASGLSGLESGRALRVMKEDALKCPSPNSGWTMAAAAGALGVRLEKNGEYTLNVQGRNPVPADLQRGITLILVSTLLLMPLAVLLVFILAPIGSIIRGGSR